MEQYRPKARTRQILVQELPDEVLIYDTERNEVHCLNGTAARVWTLCDGERTVAQIARLVASDLEPATADSLVWSALDQFVERHLLEEPLETPPDLDRPSEMTRRQMMLSLGLIAGFLPVVESIVSPPAALASSGGTGNTGMTPK